MDLTEIPTVPIYLSRRKPPGQGNGAWARNSGRGEKKEPLVWKALTLGPDSVEEDFEKVFHSWEPGPNLGFRAPLNYPYF